jgi:plasmid stabilization system protein ParE
VPSRGIRWTEHAVAQLAGIIEYISLASPVYAEQTLERLVGRLDQACVFPDSARVVPEVGRIQIRDLI